MKRLLLVAAIFAGLSASAFAQSSPPLRVREVDLSPSVYGVTTLVFSNGSVTCVGKVCTVVTGGGGSGTVTSSTQYRIASYPATGTTVDGLATLVTDASGGLNLTPSATSGVTLRVNDTDGTARVRLGSRIGTTTQGAVYIANTAPSSTNYALAGDGSSVVVNASNSVNFAIGGNIQGVLDSSGLWGINKVTSIGGQMHVVSGSASRIGLRVDSAASPSVNVFQASADNGTTTHFAVRSTGATLFTTPYGELYEASGATAITVTTAGTFYQWASTTVGLSSGVTASATTDNLIVATGNGGVFNLTATMSFTGSNNSTVDLGIFVNGSLAPNCQGRRKLSASGDVGELAITCIAAVAAAQTVDLRVSSDTNGNTVTPVEGSLTITRIGN